MKKCLCILLAAVCFVLLTTSFPAFAADTEGSMEVTAHIEAAPAEPSETSPPAADSSGTVVPDHGTPSAGRTIFAGIVISLISLISVPAIYLRFKNHKKL